MALYGCIRRVVDHQCLARRFVDRRDVVVQEGVKGFREHGPSGSVQQSVEGGSFGWVKVDHLLDEVLLPTMSEIRKQKWKYSLEHPHPQ